MTEVTPTSGYEIYTTFKADDDKQWTNCDSWGCDSEPPVITVRTEGDELHIAHETIWDEDQAPAMIGRMFLAGIPFGVLRDGSKVTLTADVDQLENVVTMLRAAGADVKVSLAPSAAEALIAKLGGRWRQ